MARRVVSDSDDDNETWSPDKLAFVDHEQNATDRLVHQISRDGDSASSSIAINVPMQNDGVTLNLLKSPALAAPEQGLKRRRTTMEQSSRKRLRETQAPTSLDDLDIGRSPSFKPAAADRSVIEGDARAHVLHEISGEIQTEIFNDAVDASRVPRQHCDDDAPDELADASPCTKGTPIVTAILSAEQNSIDGCQASAAKPGGASVENSQRDSARPEPKMETTPKPKTSSNRTKRTKLRRRRTTGGAVILSQEETCDSHDFPDNTHERFTPGRTTSSRADENDAEWQAEVSAPQKIPLNDSAALAPTKRKRGRPRKADASNGMDVDSATDASHTSSRQRSGKRKTNSTAEGPSESELMKSDTSADMLSTIHSASSERGTEESPKKEEKSPQSASKRAILSECNSAANTAVNPKSTDGGTSAGKPDSHDNDLKENASSGSAVTMSTVQDAKTASSPCKVGGGSQTVYRVGLSRRMRIPSLLSRIKR